MEPIISLSEGKIKGLIKTDSNGDEFFSFTCIPYGKAPVGDLRFKAPLPSEPWKGVKDATKEDKIGCQQFEQNFNKKVSSGTEDCLNLHVFTKKLPNKEVELKPVMVFIHGGGFLSGNHETSIYGPKYFMAKDMVLVTITYRVGFLGFIRFNDQSLDVPGNAGLKDQVLALKWVQKNIKHFNGDPNNVTIFGESAGAASVEYLVLSPSAKNLFHKAIIQSGSTFSTWARGTFDPADLADFLEKPNLSEKDILKLLTEMPVKQLIDLQAKYLKSKNVFGHFGILAPVLEYPNPTSFLTEEPITIIQSGNYNAVPIITGYNDNEGALYDFMLKVGEWHDMDLRSQITAEKMLPRETNLNDKEQVEKITSILTKYYYNEDSKEKIYLLLTDSMFFSGMLTSARNQAKVSKNPVYLYRFSMDTNLNAKRWLGLECKGASHADDLCYLFSNDQNIEIGELEEICKHRLQTLWTNFAKFGNPTPKENDLNIIWKPIENDQLNYLEIGNDLKTGINPDADRLKIWQQIYGVIPSTAKYWN